MEHIYPTFERGRIMKKNYYGRSGIIPMPPCSYNIRTTLMALFQGAGCRQGKTCCT